MPDFQSLAAHPPIKKSLNHLLGSDPVFSTLDRKSLSVFDRVRREGDFAAMIGAILGQQVSVAAARAMGEKLRVLTKGRITPRVIGKLSDDDLRGCGFSRQKIVYARGLAGAILDKSFVPEAMPDMDDEDVIEAITALKGFGVWSAQMYLIFSLARPDVWPAGDLGIQIGAQHYLRKKERPDVAAVEKLGGRFAGHRTAAALLLWDLKGIRDAEKKLKA